MAFERYNDRIFLSVYDTNTHAVEECTFYAEDDPRRRSVDRQAMEVAKYWCDCCECAFRQEVKEGRCPMCGGVLEVFEPGSIRPFLEDVMPEYFENDDGFAIDELPCDKD